MQSAASSVPCPPASPFMSSLVLKKGAPMKDTSPFVRPVVVHLMLLQRSNCTYTLPSASLLTSAC